MCHLISWFYAVPDSPHSSAHMILKWNLSFGGTSSIPSRHGSIRRFGCQRLRSFAEIDPYSSVRTNPPDFAVASPLPKWRVHGDFHCLDPNSSTVGIRNPPPSTAQSILWSSLIRPLYVRPAQKRPEMACFLGFFAIVAACIRTLLSWKSVSLRYTSVHQSVYRDCQPRNN